MSEGPQCSVAASADVAPPELLRALVGDTDNRALALGHHASRAITDPRGNLTCVSDQFRRLSSYAREELLGQNVRLINSGCHPTALFRGLLAANAACNSRARSSRP